MRQLRINEEMLDFDDVFDGSDIKMEENEETDPTDWTIITALDCVLNKSYRSELKPELWKGLESPLAYLRERLQMTDMQIVFLAILIDSGKALTWKAIGGFLHCSRLKVMTFTDEIDELTKRQWVTKRISNDFGARYQAYGLEFGVIDSLRHNRPFVPPKMDGLSEQEFVDKLANRIKKGMRSHEIDFESEEHWMMNLVELNRQLPLCRFIHEMEDEIHDKSLFLMIVADYALYGGGENEGLLLDTIDELYPDDFECNFIRQMMENGDHYLFTSGMVEYKCEDGIVNNQRYVLTTKAKEKMLADYKPHHQIKKNGLSSQLTSHNSIREKSLYFNAPEERQLQRLATILQKDQFSLIQKRLEDSGMRRGFACLFYGAPGTGKTESVLQIARMTGRDIMQVDIANMRDKWVGESEKNIKSVFTRYRALCKESELAPILFFNEADALINKRNEETSHAVDKMENTMQNILLQEMEDLDGILIATTNLTSNLDTAFERRFLFKVEFHKPETKVKAKIWNTMIQSLSSEEASILASRYDFSGGQIENIARKNTIEFILTGNTPTLTQLDNYCREELLANKKTRTPIAGFRS